LAGRAGGCVLYTPPPPPPPRRHRTAIKLGELCYSRGKSSAVLARKGQAFMCALAVLPGGGGEGGGGGGGEAGAVMAELDDRTRDAIAEGVFIRTGLPHARGFIVSPESTLHSALCTLHSDTWTTPRVPPRSEHALRTARCALRVALPPRSRCLRPTDPPLPRAVPPLSADPKQHRHREEQHRNRAARGVAAKKHRPPLPQGPRALCVVISYTMAAAWHMACLDLT
jgi:hypothetical protein